MKRYSEHNEDEFLGRYFKDLDNGFFVDIGANDGVKGSNTRKLYDRGWSGICVEACIGTYCELLKNYQGQDRVRVVHSAVTDKLGMVPFWERTSHACFGLNSADKRFAGLFDPGTFQEVTTPSLRLQDLALPKTFDFLSVDTEGGDLLILSTLDTATVSPRLICAELDKFDHGPKIHAVMKEKGYKHILDVETNGFFERV